MNVLGPDATARPRRSVAATDPVVAVFHDATTGRPPGLERLAESFAVRYATDERELAAALREAAVLYVSDFRSEHLRAAWRPDLPLRWVHAGGAGVDAILFPELVASDVVLTSSGGVFDDAMAEYVLGLLLAFAKDLPRTLALQAERRWRHRETERLAGASLLLVGAGPVARAVARLARAFGMNVTAVARSARDDPELGHILSAADLRHALPGADYVVIATPLTPETEGLVGAAELAAMKPTARVVNVGRGRIVDEEALVEALRTRRIAGAALDVFPEEPLAREHPLWELPGTIVSPHMSGDFAGWRRALSELFLENLGRYVEGRPLLNVVDKERGYVLGERR